MNKFNNYSNLKNDIKQIKKIENECSLRIKILKSKKKQKERERNKILRKDKNTKKELVKINKYDSEIDSLLNILKNTKNKCNILKSKDYTVTENNMYKKEDKLKEDKLKEDKLKEDKLKEDKLKEDKLKEDKLKEDKLKEDKLKEGDIIDNIPEEESEEDNIPEEESEEDNIPEEESEEDNIPIYNEEENIPVYNEESSRGEENNKEKIKKYNEKIENIKNDIFEYELKLLKIQKLLENKSKNIKQMQDEHLSFIKNKDNIIKYKLLNEQKLNKEYEKLKTEEFIILTENAMDLIISSLKKNKLSANKIKIVKIDKMIKEIKDIKIMLKTDTIKIIEKQLSTVSDILEKNVDSNLIDTKDHKKNIEMIKKQIEQNKNIFYNK